MKQFLKKDQLQLINGGYLSNHEEAPVFNAEFIKAQKDAEYLVTFATMAKGKDFKGKEAINLSDFRNEVMKAVSRDQKISHISIPKLAEGTTTKKLQDEAMAFIASKEKAGVANKVNDFLQNFNIIHEFEEHGLFFEQEIVKLNKIYTMKEIIAAAEQVIDLL